MKKEPLYVTMGVNGGSKEDPIEDSRSRIKEAKNVAIRNHHLQRVREANSSNATQQTNKAATSVQIAQETIARRAEESKYVGICKRFPLQDAKRKANSVQDSNAEESANMASRSSSNRIMCKQQKGQNTANLLGANGTLKDCDSVQTNGQRINKEEMNDNIINGFHHLQTKTEVKGSKVPKVSLLNLDGGESNAEMKGWSEREVNCANASEAGDAGAGGMEGNAGERQELTQQDKAGKSDGGNEEEEKEKNGEQEEEQEEQEEDEDGGGKSDGGNETRKAAGHSPHQNNPTKGLAGGEGKQNNCNGRDNSGMSESSKLDSILAQFEALEREDQVRNNCRYLKLIKHFAVRIEMQVFFAKI